MVVKIRAAPSAWMPATLGTWGSKHSNFYSGITFDRATMRSFPMETCQLPTSSTIPFTFPFAHFSITLAQFHSDSVEDTIKAFMTV